MMVFTMFGLYGMLITLMHGMFVMHKMWIAMPHKSIDIDRGICTPNTSWQIQKSVCVTVDAKLVCTTYIVADIVAMQSNQHIPGYSYSYAGRSKLFLVI